MFVVCGSLLSVVDCCALSVVCCSSVDARCVSFVVYRSLIALRCSLCIVGC